MTAYISSLLSLILLLHSAHGLVVPRATHNCRAPAGIVCKPSGDTLLGYVPDEYSMTRATCEGYCKNSHRHDTTALGYPPDCNFYTFDKEAGVGKCALLSNCEVHPGDQESGTWSTCDDSAEFLCEPYHPGDFGGEIPVFDDKESYWGCGSQTFYSSDGLFPGTKCKASCPNFNDGANTTFHQVTATCIYDANSGASWTISPDNALDTAGIAIVAPNNPSHLACGCAAIPVEVHVNGTGNSFTCSENGTPVAEVPNEINQDMECTLICEGSFMWDLYCSHGTWSVPQIQSGAQITCEGSGNNGFVTLSTFWPTDPTTGGSTDAPTDAPTNPPTNAPTNPPTNAPTNAPTNDPTDAPKDAPTTTAESAGVY